MTVKVTLNYGPIEVEISGEDREDVQSELLGLIEFLNENEADLELSLPAQQPTPDVDTGTEQSEEGEDEGHPLASIARELNIPFEDIDNLIYVDPELEEDIQLIVDPEELGDLKVERQRNAAYLVLYVWDECYGKERMETSKLIDILALAGISTNDLYEAWQDGGQGKFDSRGKGASASVTLTGVGKRTAKTKIKDLVSEAS